MRITFTILVLSCLTFNANAESVYVKYRGAVGLAAFQCNWVNRSSLVNRLCYDEKETYVIVMLRDTYYHYGEVPKPTVSAWFSASSMGRFYNANIKGRYDCRINRMPAYDNQFETITNVT